MKNALMKPGRITSLNEFIGQPGDFNYIEGNTIKKAYLCHATSRMMKPGDLLLIYLSESLKAITTVGTIEQVHYGLADVDEIHDLVRKRTVYSKEDIQKMVEEPHDLVVILFWQNFHLQRDKFISRQVLEEKDILTQGAGMSITNISHERYLKIKEIWGIPEKYVDST